MAYKYSSRNGQKVRLIALHTAEGATTAESLGNYFYRNDVQASSHVGIDDTHGLQYVDYAYAAWTMRNANPYSENAELCGFAAWTRDQWLNQHKYMLDQAAQWIANRCHARGIPIRKLSPQQVGAGEWGVCGHADYTYGTSDGTHTDPGVNFPWDYVMEKAGGAPPSSGGGGSNPGKFSWSLPSGHYYGNIAGPNKSHGGYYADERDEVKNIQQWLIYKGCVSNVASSNWATSGWADGKWENPTDTAMRLWHDRFYPGQPYPTQCWSDDYARLATP